jgi:DNA-binding NarL/FixJ family response regulator
MNRLVIIADDAQCAQIIRCGLRHAAQCDVVGYVSARRPFAMALRSANPDIVLIDEADGAADVFACIREARMAARDAKILLLTGAMDPEHLAQATEAGADAALSRSIHPTSLGTLVREIAHGRIYHAFTRVAAETAEAPESYGLTPREVEILRLVAAGASNGRIARELWVTEQTVKFHLSNTYRKLGVANRTQASHYAHTCGLVTTSIERIGTGRPADTPIAA